MPGHSPYVKYRYSVCVVNSRNSDTYKYKKFYSSSMYLIRCSFGDKCTGVKQKKAKRKSVHIPSREWEILAEIIKQACKRCLIPCFDACGSDHLIAFALSLLSVVMGTLKY